MLFFFFQAEDGIRDYKVTGVQTCALPISEAGAVAAGAFDDFQDAAILVLRTPTLIWIFLGGAMVTFAVNGLIAWAAAFMERIHGLSVARVGGQFGLWALSGGVLGALGGGRMADRLQQRWRG